MEGYIVEWLSLLGRWVHLVVGIAWIGASFYFVWLDNHLRPTMGEADVQRGVGGEIWSVHGGGFYHAQKYKVAPPTLPETLHWFKWEAYTTWITGMFLIALLYWYQAEIYLIDPQVMDLGKPLAVLLGVLTIALGWIAYDQLCKSAIGNQQTRLSAIMVVILTVLAWGLCQVFSGRGAYLHFGAMLGTIMVANVYFVIMPGQRDLVAAKEAGRTPDPIHGIRARQRSLHNTYFTLPVLFVMISNHYAMIWSHQYNWLILIAISVAGALIRVYFVQRHQGKASPLPLLSAAVLIIATAAAIVPKPNAAIPDGNQTAELSEKTDMQLLFEAQQIITQRCTVCHAQIPSQAGFSAAPKGIVLETPEDLLRQSRSVYQQVVVTKAMPIGNMTQMTVQERVLIDQWYQRGVQSQ